MEFWRKKNTDTRVVFPIQKNDGTFITGAAGLDSEFALYGAHGAGAPSFGDCTHEATEIASTALYYLDVSAAELNDDYGSIIQVKSSSTGAIVQALLFHTRPDEVDVVNWKGSAAAAMTGDAYAEAALVHAHAQTIETATTAASIAAAVWNALVASYATAVTFGKYLGGAPAGATVAADLIAAKTDTSSLLKGRYNKNYTDPATGDETVFEDDNTTVHKSGPIYEDIAGTMPFDGSGANRRDRMT